MSVPYSFRVFFDTEISPKIIATKLENFYRTNYVDKKNLINNKFSFGIDMGVLGTNIVIDVDFQSDKGGFYYEFSLLNLVKISIVLIIIFAFILSGIKSLIIIPSVAIFLMYIVYIFHVKNKLNTVFEELLHSVIEPETMSPEQLEWLNNPAVCPACGSRTVASDRFCVECGLNLQKHRTIKQDKSSRTGYFNYRLRY